VVLVTHDAELAAERAGRAVHMVDGRMADGLPGEGA
jgi:predicted ABC-type transport system involved in lysophospholipase L1 biosynthesis ATPase subunit